MAKKLYFLASFLSSVVKIKTFLSSRNSWWKIFFERNTFLWRLWGFREIFLETWRSISFKVNKIVFYKSRKFLRNKSIFWRNRFLVKPFRCLARKYRTFVGKFEICLSKLQFTCPEANFTKNVVYQKKWWIEQFLWDTERNIFGLFAWFIPQVCQTSILQIEETSSVKLLIWKSGSTLLFGFLVVKLWQAHERFIFWRLMGRFGLKFFFEKLVFLKLLCDLNRMLLDVWLEILGQVCWSYILLGQ